VRVASVDAIRKRTPQGKVRKKRKALASAPSCNLFLNAANSERVRMTASANPPKLAVTAHLDV